MCVCMHMYVPAWGRCCLSHPLLGLSESSDARGKLASQVEQFSILNDTYSVAYEALDSCLVTLVSGNTVEA